MPQSDKSLNLRLNVQTPLNNGTHYNVISVKLQCNASF